METIAFNKPDYNLNIFPLLICHKCLIHIPYIEILSIKSKITLKINCPCSYKENKIGLKEYLQILMKKVNLNQKNCYTTCCNNHQDVKHLTLKQPNLYCSICQHWMCPECFMTHHNNFPNHILLNKSINLSCDLHNDSFYSYCFECEQSFCLLSAGEHYDHRQTRLNSKSIKNFMENYNRIQFNLNLIKQHKDKLISAFDNKANIKEEILKAYNHNLKQNLELQKLCLLIYNTIQLTDSYPNYDLISSLNSIHINKQIKTAYYNDYDYCNSTSNTNDLKSHYKLAIEFFKETFVLLIGKKISKKVKFANNIKCAMTIEGKGPKALTSLHNGCIVLSLANQIEISKTSLLSSFQFTILFDDHIGQVKALIQLQDGRLISGDDTGIIKAWNLSTLQCLLTIKAYSIKVYSLIQLPNETLLSSGDDLMRLFSVKTFKCIRTIDTGNIIVNTMILLSNGQLVLGYRYGKIAVVDSNTLEYLRFYYINISNITLCQLLDERILCCNKNKREIYVLNSKFEPLMYFKTKYCTTALIQLKDGQLITSQRLYQSSEAIQVWDVINY